MRTLVTEGVPHLYNRLLRPSAGDHKGRPYYIVPTKSLCVISTEHSDAREARDIPGSASEWRDLFIGVALVIKISRLRCASLEMTSLR